MTSKTTPLKALGVPLSARILFRLQWAPFICLVVLLVLSSPLLAVLALLNEAVMEFVVGLGPVLDTKAVEIQRHRDKLVALYARPK